MKDAESCRTLEAYLAAVGRFRGHAYGRQFRRQFADHRGTADLAMLASPTQEEYESFEKITRAMTEGEKQAPEALSDQAIQAIARRAGVEPALAGLFINGFVLARRRAGLTGPSGQRQE